MLMSAASCAPGGSHFHDVGSIYVSVAIQVIGQVILGITGYRTPPPGNEHDVDDIHITVAI
jgi:hypothetical protein